MRNDLTLISKKDMTREEWLKFRLNGIGGSEVATALNLNPYQCATELFYKKVNEEIENIQNERMFWGTIHEDTIANIWQYWENDIETTMKNHEENKIIRKCRRFNYIAINPDYPHLFANLDRLYDSNKGILEIKTISDFAVNQWESGIPPYHVIQLQVYLGILGCEYGELAMLKNGRNFDVIPFQRNEKIIEGVFEKTAEFWQRIIEARELKKQGLPFEHLEPEPGNSDAYEKYMKEKFKSKPITIEGTAEILEIAKEEKRLSDEIKSLETLKQGKKNELISVICEAEKINFGASGYVSFKENTKGVRTFLNKVKAT